MNTRNKLLAAGCAIAITACSGGTPSCEDSETIDVLSSIVDGRVSETVEKFNRINGVEMSADVPHEFVAIQTLSYDEASDSYQCKATIKTDIEVTWASPTNLPVSNRQESEFSYSVHSVFDSDGNRDTEVEYAIAGLMGVPLSTATGLLEEQFAPIRRQSEQARLQQEQAEYSNEVLAKLEDARNNGIWLEEFEAVEKMLRAKVQVPDPTQQQVSLRDYGDLSRGSPAYCASAGTSAEGACAYMLEKYGAERQKWLQYEEQIVAARSEIWSCSSERLRSHGSYAPGMRVQIGYEKECRDSILTARLGAGAGGVGDVERCVDERVKALRTEIGDEAAIGFDQLAELESDCVGG